ncbi:hypothetical protein [Alkalicoccus halolimnae]|uniref:Uncharacterized protein n=1 Tax=Alkalicoccus halolimnae TaxID=1667239 RepID=A0A5C7FLC7_9BACI|nr:hypothetical protein [Alkalicoccus halolimnae]TXF86186.1 hypothetical protein FTX54_06130 [Alkalicoccus halolimnae]
MEETKWDMQEVKRLKKKRLIHTNLIMLILFFLLVYYIQSGGSVLVLFGLCCVIMWMMIIQMLFTLKTGKTIGTKTSQLVQAFDRDHKGEKSWKRRRTAETIFLVTFNLFLTISLFIFNFEALDLRFSSTAFPFIGSWIGYNIGESYRINRL